MFYYIGSPYLNTRLRGLDASHNDLILYLDGVSSACFGQILDFIYCGKVRVKTL